MIFIPGMYIRQGLPTLYISDFLLIICFGLLLARGKNFPGHPYRDSKTFRIFSWLCGYIICVTAIAGLFFDSRLVSYFTGLFAALVVVKPLLLCYVIVRTIRSVRDLEMISYCCLICTFLSILLMIFQKFDLFDVNYLLTAKYRPAHETRISDLIYRIRVSGPFGNTNDAGTALSILGSMSYAMFLTAKSRWRQGLCLLAFFLSIYAVVTLAQTRQGIIVLLMSILAIQIFSLLFNINRRLLFIIIPVFMYGFIEGISWLQEQGALADRFAFLFGERSIMQEGSMEARLLRWPYFLDDYDQLFLLTGGGFHQFIIDPIVWDSGYLYILIISGYPGLLLYCWFLLVAGLDSIQILKTSFIKERQMSWPPLVALGCTVAILMTTFVNTLINNGKIMSIAMMVLSLFLANQKLLLSSNQEPQPTSTIFMK